MDISTVWSLRTDAKDLSGVKKEKKLKEAITLAEKLFDEEPESEQTERALAWPCIDLCNYYISTRAIKNANTLYNFLWGKIKNDYDAYDPIVLEHLEKLRPKLDTFYSQIQYAEDLSKKGDYKKAIALMRSYKENGQLIESYHEAYGWIIYRFLKNEKENLQNDDIRNWLFEYINLKNGRPSLLHSCILKFAHSYAKEDRLNIYIFFILWDPAKLRHEDVSTEYVGDKIYPPFLSSLLRAIVESHFFEIDVHLLLKKISPINSFCEQEVLDLLRKPLFFEFKKYEKESNFTQLEKHLFKYTDLFKNLSGSEWHSKIINLAHRYFDGDKDINFVKFFEPLGMNSLRESDWEKVEYEEKLYNGVAVKAVLKAVKVYLNDKSQPDVSWLINGLDTACTYFPEDSQLFRKKALLHLKLKEIDIAKSIFTRLSVELGEQYYFWRDFSQCFTPEEDKVGISMLIKAIELQTEEDFLGDIRLDLAERLIRSDLTKEAKIELLLYEEHRTRKSWKIPERYISLYSKVEKIQTVTLDNNELYQIYKGIAEEYSYKDIDWQEVVFVDRWQSKNGKHIFFCTNKDGINLSFKQSNFKDTNKLSIGNIIRVKTYLKDNRHIPLMIEPTNKADWSILDREIAVIDYINIDKKIIHFITANNQEIFIQQPSKQYKIGDIVIGRLYKKTDKEKQEIYKLGNISPTDKNEAIEAFEEHSAVVDHVNESKFLFHLLIDTQRHGVVHFSDTSFRPITGDCFQVRVAAKVSKGEYKYDCRIINLIPSKEDSSALITTFRNIIEINEGNAFGFVTLNDQHQPYGDSCYVEPHYVKEASLIDGNYVSGKAILSYNRKKQKWGWKAYFVKRAS